MEKPYSYRLLPTQTKNANMNTTFTSLIVMACLIAAVLLGRALRRVLPEDHLSAESRDTIKLAMGLVATMSALDIRVAGKFGEGLVRH